MRRVVKPTLVPLSGFLNLSAVSWQTQTSWPCFVPQPFLGFSFRDFPSQKSRTLSGRLAPLRSSTDVLERRLSDLITAGFPDSHTHAQLPGFPDDYELPFHASRRRPFPVALDPSYGTHPVPLASPTSEPCSSCESVRADPSCPAPTADPLLVFRLSRDFSSHASDPRTRPDHEGLNMPLRPKAPGHDPRDLAAPHAG